MNDENSFLFTLLPSGRDEHLVFFRREKQRVNVAGSMLWFGFVCVAAET